VTTVHGGDIFSLRGRLLTSFKRYTLEHADAVTVNSSATERAVREVTPKIRALRKIPMGVSIDQRPELDKVAEIRRQYRRGKGPLLIFVGRLVEEKGLEDLIKAVAILGQTLPDVTALVVGQGQDKGLFEKMVEESGLSGHICFAGWVEAHEVLSYLAAGDIFVGPSRRSKEGWIEAQGLTFLEAMIARKPVIATRIGGIVDTVMHEETGLLIDERSPAQIAQGVLRLTEDRELAERLSRRGYDLATTTFSRQRCATAFSELFQEVMQCREENRK